MTVDAETMKALNEVKMLLSHKIPDGSLKEIFKYMLQLTVQTLAKRKGQNRIKEDISSQSISEVNAASSEVINKVFEKGSIHAFSLEEANNKAYKMNSPIRQRILETIKTQAEL